MCVLGDCALVPITLRNDKWQNQQIPRGVFALVLLNHSHEALQDLFEFRRCRPNS